MPPGSPPSCARTASSTSSPTASSDAIRSASPCSPPSNPTTSRRSRERSTSLWTAWQAETMLLLHEVHTVAGSHEDAFEEAFRKGWMSALGSGDDARLLYYL